MDAGPFHSFNIGYCGMFVNYKKIRRQVFRLLCIIPDPCRLLLDACYVSLATWTPVLHKLTYSQTAFL